MAQLEARQPDGVVRPVAHYATALRAGDRLYVGGLTALDENAELVGAGSAHEQTLQICRVLERICADVGAGLANVAQCTLVIADRSYYKDVNAAFAEAFGDHRPARATVVAGLVREEFLVELLGIVVEIP